MAIYFKVQEKPNPQRPDEPKKFYAGAASIRRTDLEEIAESIAQSGSTVGKADVYAVLVELTDELTTRIAAGERVHLGDFGSFYATLKSEGVATPEEVRASIVKDKNVRFAIGKDIEKALDKAEVRKLPKL